MAAFSSETPVTHGSTLLRGSSRIPQLRQATLADTAALFRLMQYYFFESSSWSREDVDEHGLYDVAEEDVRAALDRSADWARMIHVDGHLAGFVLVESAPFGGRNYPELADLFVLPKYRRMGVAAHVVNALLAPGSGTWLIAAFKSDAHAYGHWQRNLVRLGFRHEEQSTQADAAFHIFLVEAAPSVGLTTAPAR